MFEQMSLSDVCHSGNVALLLQVFIAVSPMMIHQVKGMTLVIMMKDEVFHLKIYKI